MPDIYQQAETITNKIEAELKALKRWDSEPLPQQKYENMGAFGSNTMAFEQWLQFILIPRIREIVKENGGFPAGSMLVAYAIRIFGGDPNSSQLHGLLYELDKLVNGPAGEYEEADPAKEETEYVQEPVFGSPSASSSISLGDTAIPPVLFTLAGILPDFEGEDLESQLQTFDTFLAILSPAMRPAISDLLKQAAEKSLNPTSGSRIEKAAQSVANGGRAAEPYDHGAAMKKYSEDHKKQFPDS